MTGNLSISWQYIVLGTRHIGGNIEFHYYSMVLVVVILVGIVIDVIGGIHNDRYDELINSACWHIGGHDDYP